MSRLGDRKYANGAAEAWWGHAYKSLDLTAKQITEKEGLRKQKTGATVMHNQGLSRLCLM